VRTGLEYKKKINPTANFVFADVRTGLEYKKKINPTAKSEGVGQC
jgi:hypothetical protein